MSALVDVDVETVCWLDGSGLGWGEHNGMLLYWLSGGRGGGCGMDWTDSSTTTMTDAPPLSTYHTSIDPPRMSHHHHHHPYAPLQPPLSPASQPYGHHEGGEGEGEEDDERGIAAAGAGYDFDDPHGTGAATAAGGSAVAMVKDEDDEEEGGYCYVEQHHHPSHGGLMGLAELGLSHSNDSNASSTGFIGACCVDSWS